MNRKLLLLIILFSLTYTSFAQIILSEKAEASLITVGPGKTIYTLWGHSIFRINDPVTGLDLVYNFGVMPRRDSVFIKNFISGNLWFEVHESNFEQDFYIYTSQERTLREIKLNLKRDEIQQLFEYMRERCQGEENRYLYDFFHDNCATAFRNMFDKVDGVYLEIPPIDREMTFRDLIAPYLDNYSWGKFGLFFIMNSIADKPITSADTMSFPDYLERYFMVSRIADNYGSRDLVINKASVPLNTVDSVLPAEDFWYSPLVVFSLIFLLAVYLSLLRKKAVLFDYLLFIITGFAGSFLLFIWLFTNHIYIHANWNIIWAFPLHLPAAFLVFRDSKIKLWYFRINSIILFMLLPASFFIPQKMPIEILPLIFTLFLRSAVLGRISVFIPERAAAFFMKLNFTGPQNSGKNK